MPHNQRVMNVSRPPVLIVAGTRPEAIKLAPVHAALAAAGDFEPVLLATSQHRELLLQALAPFGLAPAIDLDVMARGQSPTRVAALVMRRLEPHLARLRPAWTVVQGDTATAFAAAVASFYAGVPVAHVEAGLRTGDLAAPFPEEFHRRAIATAAALHLAPTPRAAANLLAEGVAADRVHVVGNTVVDAVRAIMDRPDSTAGGAGALGGASEGRERAGEGARAPGVEANEVPLVLVTMHRRESFGGGVQRVASALRRLAGERAGRLRIVYPVHPNPAVDRVMRAELAGVAGIELHAPLGYVEFLGLLARARFALSDSGGVQEEGPTLGVPVLVLRDVTERPEAVESGWARLVGTDEEAILAAARALLDDPAARAAMTGPNPFGDGHAGERIADLLAGRAAAAPGEAR
jgi:UDP-N-acetylglucosamine 2-epimerase (non-hydrolysing)